MRTNKWQTRRKKIFQNSTRRLVEIKLTLASHNHQAFLRAPRRTRWQKRYILNLRKHFFSHTLRQREINSLEILNALHHLSVRYAGVYPADRLPRMWIRSTVIVVNTDDHNRLDEHWIAFYIDEHGTYFDSYSLPSLDPRRFRRNSTTNLLNTTTLQGILSNLWTILLYISTFYV